MEIYHEAKEKLSKQLEKEKQASYRIGAPILIRVLKILGMIVTYILYTVIGAVIYKLLEPSYELGAAFFAFIALIGNFAVYKIYWGYVVRSFSDEYHEIFIDIPGIEESYEALLTMRAKPRTVEEMLVYYDKLARILYEKGETEESQKIYALLRETRKEKESGGFKMKVLNIRYAVIEENSRYFLFDRRPDYRGLLFYPVQWRFPRKIYPLRKYQYEGLVNHYKKEPDQWVPTTFITAILFVGLTTVLAMALIFIIQLTIVLTNPLTRYFTDTQFILAIFWTIILAVLTMEWMYYRKKREMGKIRLADRPINLTDVQQMSVYPTNIQLKTIQAIAMQFGFFIFSGLMLYLKFTENMHISFVLIYPAALLFVMMPLAAYNELEKYSFKETDFH